LSISTSLDASTLNQSLQMSTMSQTSVLTTSLHIQAAEDSQEIISRADIPSGNALQNQDVNGFLTSNGQPTGQEPNINPQWWPEHEHRRVPLYQSAVTH
jgi:hypothetical protein